MLRGQPEISLAVMGVLIACFLTYYNTEQYHEALNNLTPADVYFGRAKEVLTRRDEIKQQTLHARRLQFLQVTAI